MADAAEHVVRPGRSAWVIITVVAGLLGVMTAIGSVVLLLSGRWMETLLGFLQVMACYWFGAGAWLRTPWATTEGREAPPGPPILSERRAHWYILLALFAAILTTVALALQVVNARGG